MDNSLQQPELQLRTLRLYGELLCRREHWSRQLVLAAFPGVSRTGLAAAASLAGAVSLVIDSDTATTKMHFRDGAFDFIVNTLDEALRAIKNEIRQGHPLAIGLMAEPRVMLAEAADRGLAAAFVLTELNDADDPLTSSLGTSDVARVAFGEPTAELNGWLSRRGWSAAELSSPTFDLPPDDRARQKWLRDLPSHQRSVRQSKRWIWLTDAERSAIA